MFNENLTFFVGDDEECCHLPSKTIILPLSTGSLCITFRSSSKKNVSHQMLGFITSMCGKCDNMCIWYIFALVSYCNVLLTYHQGVW